jgi:addiction module HigA family antidote
MTTRAPSEPPPAIHPGEALREDFLVELGMTPETLATITDIPIDRIEALLEEEEDFSVDDAVRISDALDTSPSFWLNLQASYTRWALSHDAVAN